MCEENKQELLKTLMRPLKKGRTFQNGKMPIGIQRKRTRGWKKPVGAINVARPSLWGNPFYVRESGLYRKEFSVRHENFTEIIASFETKREAQAEAVRLFEIWFDDTVADPGSDLYVFRQKYGWKGFSLACAVNMLRGKDLMCWCALDDPCHRNVLLRKANK